MEFLDIERLVARSGTERSSILTAPCRRRADADTRKRFSFGKLETRFLLKRKWVSKIRPFSGTKRGLPLIEADLRKYIDRVCEEPDD